MKNTKYENSIKGNQINEIINTLTKSNQVQKTKTLDLGKKEYDCLKKYNVELAAVKRTQNYHNNQILIRKGFINGVDYNMSCKEWEILQNPSWLTDNVINQALGLLKMRIKSTDQNYWIFNTYFMSLICKFLYENDEVGKRLHTKIPKKKFQYDRLYCVCNIGNRHWAVLTVNFKQKTMKYIDSIKGNGTIYISSIMHWLDYVHSKFDSTEIIWDEWKFENPFTKCTTQTNGYDCGLYAIKYIDFDSLDASLMFSTEMDTYRTIVQYSICTMTYKFLGVHEVDVPNIECIPDTLNDDIASSPIQNIELILNNDNKSDIQNEEESLTSFGSHESQCDKRQFMMLHKDFETSSSTSKTCTNANIRWSVYQYVKNSLQYFNTLSKNKDSNDKDWYITPLKCILDKKKTDT